MSDDLASRLRRAFGGTCILCREAADALEAKDRENKRLRGIARDAAEAATQHQAEVLLLRAENEALKQAEEWGMREVDGLKALLDRAQANFWRDHAELECLRAELALLKPTCAICGRDSPCEPSETACTFDPSPKALYDDNCRLRVENESLKRNAERLRESAYVVRVCPEKDIECGTRAENWCGSCPLRRAEVAALKRDAERYRWLRDHGCAINSERRAIENELLPAGQSFSSLDAAIDAALSQQERP